MDGPHDLQAQEMVGLTTTTTTTNQYIILSNRMFNVNKHRIPFRFCMFEISLGRRNLIGYWTIIIYIVLYMNAFNPLATGYTISCSLMFEEDENINTAMHMV